MLIKESFLTSQHSHGNMNVLLHREHIEGENKVILKEAKGSEVGQSHLH